MVWSSSPTRSSTPGRSAACLSDAPASSLAAAGRAREGRRADAACRRNAIIVQTALASLFTIVTFGPWASSSDFPNQVYLIFQAAVTVIWCLSMILLFADIFLVRRAFPQRFEEVRVSSTNLLDPERSRGRGVVRRRRGS